MNIDDYSIAELHAEEQRQRETREKGRDLFCIAVLLLAGIYALASLLATFG